MKKLLKVARKRAGLKLFDVKGGVAQLRHVPGDCLVQKVSGQKKCWKTGTACVPGDCLVQKVLGPEEMLEDGQYRRCSGQKKCWKDGVSFERVSVYAEVPGDCLVQKVLGPEETGRRAVHN
jgi:hypothetical protein